MPIVIKTALFWRKTDEATWKPPPSKRPPTPPIAEQFFHDSSACPNFENKKPPPSFRGEELWWNSLGKWTSLPRWAIPDSYYSKFYLQRNLLFYRANWKEMIWLLVRSESEPISQFLSCNSFQRTPS